jgi:hypothetical protein
MAFFMTERNQGVGFKAARMLSIVVLVISIPSASASARPNTKEQKFQCNNAGEQSATDRSSKHTVTLTWKASVSLPPPLSKG